MTKHEFGSKYDQEYEESIEELPEWMDMMDNQHHINAYPLQVNEEYNEHGVPIPAYEAEEALRGYEIYNEMPHGSATLHQVASSSSGIKGYAQYARDTLAEWEQYSMEIDEELMITQGNAIEVESAEGEQHEDKSMAEQMEKDNAGLNSLLKELAGYQKENEEIMKEITESQPETKKKEEIQKETDENAEEEAGRDRVQ